MKYALEGYTSEATIDAVENSLAKKFIYELNHRFGVKVIDFGSPNNDNYSNIFRLTDSTGAFLVGRAWTEGRDKNLDYNYRSPIVTKERGRTPRDKQTYYSSKLSTLMSTLNKNNVIPKDTQDIINYHSHSFRRARSEIVDSFGARNKRDEFYTDEIHDMLKYIVGESTSINFLDKCKKVLDIYNNVDKIKLEVEYNANRFFVDGFYAVGVDMFNHIIIGELKMENGNTLKIVKPFERVRDFSNHSHLQSVMLMQKVYHEQQGKYDKFQANYFAPHTGYLKDLDLVQVEPYKYSSETYTHELSWILIPCSSIHPHTI